MRLGPWLRLSMGGIVVIAFGLASIEDAHAADKDCMDAASEGQVVRDRGHLLEARAHFQNCAQSKCPSPIPTYCGDWLSDVGKKIPSLVIRVVDESGRDIAEASVLLDDRTIALDGRAVEVDPGKHRIRISRPESKPFETEIIAAQGEKDRIIVGKLVAEEGPPRPRPPIPPPAPGRPVRAVVPTSSWMAWGIGAAGLLSFSIFAVKARLDYDGYAASCGQRCSISERDSVATAVTLADVSLVVGLVGAGVGTVLFLLHPKVDADARGAAMTRGAP